VTTLGIYTRWVGQLSAGKETSLATRLLRRWFAQLALNAVLIAGIFGGAVYAAQRPPTWLAELGETTMDALLWLAAMVLSLPLLIATFRKLQAVGLLVAETRVKASAAGERTEAIRAIVA